MEDLKESHIVLHLNHLVVLSHREEVAGVVFGLEAAFAGPGNVGVAAEFAALVGLDYGDCVFAAVAALVKVVLSESVPTPTVEQC